MYKEQQLYVAHSAEGPIHIIGRMANRHGLIAGATGTGKTVTAEEYGHIKSVRTAMDYINRHLPDELTLEEIAKRADMSPNYFSHIFKKTVGVALWDYITSKRIESAMTLITERPDRNMLDIAVDCGFNNTANFNKMFRRVTGMTPSKFRRHGEYIG